MMPLRSSFFCKCHDDGGGCAIHANLEALDAGIEPTWRCAWLVVEAVVVALMRIAAEIHVEGERYPAQLMATTGR